MKWIMLCLVLAAGCAADAVHLKQACADANSALNGAGQLLLGEIQKSEADGTAHAKLACFQAAVATLHDLTAAKDQVCSNTDAAPDYKLYIAKAVALAPMVAPVVAQYQTCIKSIKQGGK